LVALIAAAIRGFPDRAGTPGSWFDQLFMILGSAIGAWVMPFCKQKCPCLKRIGKKHFTKGRNKIKIAPSDSAIKRATKMNTTRMDDWMEQARSLRWVVMGVSGCGKSEIGRRLAQRLGVAYAEGDDDHPAANVAKMAAGTPLTDDDRHDWLLRLQSRIAAAAAQGEGLVLSCSSLKRRYRDLLRAGDPGLVFVHLQGDRELIAKRMHSRPGHFMPPALLDSQLRDLEPLQPDEAGLALDITTLPEQLVEQALQYCRNKPDQ
jgi:gluconokinase